MLAYVDSLCAALLARNQVEIRRLLSLSLAAKLPHSVREEAAAVARGRTNSFLAPVNALQYYYKLTHLIDESIDAPDIGPGSMTGRQLDLPLRAVNS